MSANEIVIADGERTIHEKLKSLELAIRAAGTIELEVRHHFSPGVYGRELHIPAGKTLVGAVHKFANLNIVSKGDISVLTEDGVKRFAAGAHIVSPAGVQRAGYAHEDTIWTTIHGTNETDLEKIEAMFVAQTYDEYLAYCESLKIEGA
ncbi:MAG: hypothetical protein V4631_20910 [Pseudomonadota bacterium]